MKDNTKDDLSRRRFLKGIGFGAVGLAITDPLIAAAEQMLGGNTVVGQKTVRRMGGNENPVGPSPKAVVAVAGQLAGLNWYAVDPDLHLAIHRYHDIDVTTREQVAWAGLNMTFINDSRVVVGVGSTEILRATTWAYLMEGGHIIESAPSYEEIGSAGRRLGSRVSVTTLPLTSNLRYDLPAIKQAIRPDTRIISICNPNNPTGILLDHETLASFIDDIDPRILIVIDEAYIHFVKDEAYQDAIHFAKTRPNVLVARTFSKVYGIAGLRVGYGVAHPDVIKKVQSHTLGPLGVTTNGIFGASAALFDRDHVAQSRRVAIEGREYLAREMTAMGLRPIPGEGNFVLADIKQDSRMLYERLVERGILITSGHRWNLPTYIRVSVGMPEDNEACIAAMKEII